MRTVVALTGVLALLVAGAVAKVGAGWTRGGRERGVGRSFETRKDGVAAVCRGLR
jgi:hypothetical protein